MVRVIIKQKENTPQKTVLKARIQLAFPYASTCLACSKPWFFPSTNQQQQNTVLKSDQNSAALLCSKSELPEGLCHSLLLSRPGPVRAWLRHLE